MVKNVSLFLGLLSLWTVCACPRWISVTPLLEDWVDGCARDVVELSENTLVDGIAYMCVVHPEGNPVSDKAAVYAKRFQKIAPLVRQKSSVRQGVLLQATMGHGGEPGVRTPWQLAVHADGAITYRFCPLDTRFLDYIAQVCRTLSAVRPDFFMVDDDTRLVWKVPGCFCPLHLSAFAQRTGRTWTREEVVAKLEAGDKAITDTWLALKYESLVTFFKTIRANFDADIPGMYCTVSSPAHFVHARAFAQMLAAPGQTPVLRGCGAPYHGNHLEAIAYLRSSYAAQRAIVGSDVLYLQEADTCPHTRWATSATRLVNHMTMLTLDGVKGAKIWISRAAPEETRSRAAYRRAFRANRAVITWAANVDLTQNGFVIPITTQSKVRDEGSDWGKNYFSRIGIAYRYGTPQTNDVVALCRDTVDTLTDAQLKQILAGRVLLDGTAAIRLTERGFAADIGVKAEVWRRETIQRELFSDSRTCDRALIAGSADLSASVKDAVIRSRLYNRPSLTADYTYIAPGSLFYTNARGGQVLTLAQALTAQLPIYHASTMYSETYRDELLRATQEVFDKIPGGIVYLGDEPMMVVAGHTAQGDNVFVLDNLELDTDDEPEIRFTQPPTKIERLAEDGSWQRVIFTCDTNGICRLKTPVYTQRPAVFRYTH